MNRSRLIKTCVALLLSAPFISCTHTTPGSGDMGPHETARIIAMRGGTNAYAAGLAVQAALESWRRSRGGFPASSRELNHTYLRGYTITAACEDGFAGEQTLLNYHRSGPADCTVQVKDFLQGGGLLSSQEMQCRSGEWTGGGATAYNTAPH